MRQSLLAAAFAVVIICGWANVAKAYEFEMTYQYSGSVFTFGAGTFENESFTKSGTILTSSNLVQPDYIGFDNDDIRLFFNADEFLISTQFSVLDGKAYSNSQVSASAALGDFAFGGTVYGSSDDQQRTFTGTISGTFSVAAVSSVPLPRSAPLFGAALLTLGIGGYSFKRRKAGAA